MSFLLTFLVKLFIYLKVTNHERLQRRNCKGKLAAIPYDNELLTFKTDRAMVLVPGKEQARRIPLCDVKGCLKRGPSEPCSAWLNSSTKGVIVGFDTVQSLLLLKSDCCYYRK